MTNNMFESTLRTTFQDPNSGLPCFATYNTESGMLHIGIDADDDQVEMYDEFEKHKCEQWCRRNSTRRIADVEEAYDYLTDLGIYAGDLDFS